MQLFEAEVAASEYMLRLAGTGIGQAYKAMALQQLSPTAGDAVVDLGCGPGADLRRYAGAVGLGDMTVTPVTTVFDSL